MEVMPQFDPAHLLEQVSAGLIGLDGAMSPQTVRLVEKFGAKKADMTLWWAMTPQSWVCPACDRSKPELVRLNKNGDLMCRLVEHHDHMGDVLQTQFQRHSVSRDKVVATDLAEEFAKRSAAMVSAYDNTIICNDCNNADPRAKKIIGAPDDFSFSPAEIRQFISVRANEPHEILPDEATRVWKSCAPSFTLRMEIIDRIAEIAAGKALVPAKHARSSSGTYRKQGQDECPFRRLSRYPRCPVCPGRALPN